MAGQYFFAHPWMRAAIAFFCAIAVASAASAEEPAVGESVGKIVELEIPAPALEGNLLGDPTVQPISIYLPPSYSAESEKRFPVLYLLHGHTGTNRTWLIPSNPSPRKPTKDGGYGRAGMLDQHRLDQIFASGEIPEFIIVAPSGRNAYKDSFWVNSSVTGNWEDYVTQDVVGFVDSQFRTIDTAASRGIAGHSGGGNGALFIAMRNSTTFGSVYAMAPCCLGPMFSLPRLTNENDDELNAFWQGVFSSMGSLESLEDIPGSFGSGRQNFWMNVEFAAAAAYAPNPERPPFYSDFLYELKEGELEINQSALERRLSLSSYHLIDKHTEDLRSLSGIMIDYGEFEMSSLVAGSAKFTEALAARAIPFTFHVYKDGDHGNLVGPRLETIGLRFFAENLRFEPDRE